MNALLIQTNYAYIYTYAPAILENFIALVPAD